MNLLDLVSALPLEAVRIDASTAGTKREEPRSAAAIAPVAKRAKEDAESSRSLISHDNDLNQPLYWDFESRPNVVNVLRLEHDPLFIVFTARPALMGNYVPPTMFADLPKLLALSRSNDQERSRQSNNAVRRPKKAIVAYARAKPLSAMLRTPLLALPWASKSFRAKLLFDDECSHDNYDDDE